MISFFNIIIIISNPFSDILISETELELVIELVKLFQLCIPHKYAYILI